jgi:hypothetical protein
MEKLQHESFNYFVHETNPANGLVIDKTKVDWPASIATTGLALASYAVAAERGFMSRPLAVERVLTTLRFFWNSPQGPESDTTGYQGFYYHCTLPPIRRTNMKSASLPTRYIDAQIGSGRKTVAQRSRTAGSKVSCLSRPNKLRWLLMLPLCPCVSL